MVKNIAILILILTVFSCSYPNVQWDLSSITINRSAVIISTKPHYVIYPVNLPVFSPSTYLTHFHVMCKIDRDKYFFEKEMTKVLYNNWLKNRVFKRFLMGDKRIDRVDEAIEIARRKKCNLVIIPYITYSFLGGESVPTRLSIKIDIYETIKGNLIWSITHSGEIRAMKEEDYVLIKEKSYYPPYAEAYLLDRLCSDIYLPIKRWAHKKTPIFILI